MLIFLNLDLMLKFPSYIITVQYKIWKKYKEPDKFYLVYLIVPYIYTFSLSSHFLCGPLVDYSLVHYSSPRGAPNHTPRRTPRCTPRRTPRY
jgi:hypothetical protein